MTRLLSFEVENFRSFYQTQHINLIHEGTRSVTALFGPNSSGKSNVILALSVMCQCIVNSAAANWTLPYEPFALRVGSSHKPTRFAVSFEHEKGVFFYEFAYNNTEIVAESLRKRSAHSEKRSVIFSRSEREFNSTAVRNGFGKRLLEKTRPETLVITKGREDNNEYSNIVFDLLSSLIVVSDNGGSQGTGPAFVEMLRDSGDMRDRTLALLKQCDFSIRDIKVESVPLPLDLLDSLPLQPEFKRMIEQSDGTSFKTVHAVRDEEQTVVGTYELDFWTQESVGTRKFFEVIVPILAALETGATIFIDEFGSYIHRTLSSYVIDMFRQVSSNPREAQLVIVSHDTSLMQGDLSRDEIYLVEKTLSEETRLFPLAETGARKGEAFEKRYRAGLYGAIPLVRK